jgi:CubicO group peptidase (beta-lactamase class C family)
LIFVLQLAALQLIEKGKLQGDTPVSTYLPVFENPIILDDITKEKPSFKPATKVVRVQHLLNFSSGLFYPITAPIHVLPKPYVAPQQEEDPVGHFYNIIKVSLLLLHYIPFFKCKFYVLNLLS